MLIRQIYKRFDDRLVQAWVRVFVGPDIVNAHMVNNILSLTVSNTTSTSVSISLNAGSFLFLNKKAKKQEDFSVSCGLLWSLCLDTMDVGKIIAEKMAKKAKVAKYSPFFFDRDTDKYYSVWEETPTINSKYINTITKDAGTLVIMQPCMWLHKQLLDLLMDEVKYEDKDY